MRFFVSLDSLSKNVKVDIIIIIIIAVFVSDNFSIQKLFNKGNIVNQFIYYMEHTTCCI